VAAPSAASATSTMNARMTAAAAAWRSVDRPTGAGGRILPFRDLFAVLFFVSLGSLVDPSALAGALPWLAFLLGAVASRQGRPDLLLAGWLASPM